MMVLLALVAAPAAAQYNPRPLNDPATGESYFFEVSGDLWLPTSDITVASAGTGLLSGLPGSQIDAERDLGVNDKHFPALQITLRPARRHKFRFQYIPISFDGDAVLKTSLVFNGIRYDIGVPVNSTLTWDAFRFAYEYDFVVGNKGFAGFLAEVKYTHGRVELDSPLAIEFAEARAPIPAIGGIGRFYVVPNISITGEVSGFLIPSGIDSRYNAHYIDFDGYGTVNFTNNVGVNIGYRVLNIGYLVNADSGAFAMNGFYFGAVFRY